MSKAAMTSPWAAERAARSEVESRKKEAILEVAAVTFVKYGFHGTTMDMIAEALDVSKPTIYKHYKNKAELLHACNERAHNRFMPLAQECRDLDGTALEKIKHYQYKSVEFYTDEFGRALALIEETGLDPEGRRHWQELREKIADIFRNIIREGIKKKEINPNVDPKLALLAIFGAFNAIATWFSPDGKYTAEQVCDQYFEVFLNGLKP